jgi:hypothetical protein
MLQIWTDQMVNLALREPLVGEASFAFEIEFESWILAVSWLTNR